MSPVIRISDIIYKRLQEIATPFSDTPATVIERLLDSHDAHENTTHDLHESHESGFHDSHEHPHELESAAQHATHEPKLEPNILCLDADSPDDLRFTRVLRAHFGDEEISPPKWTQLIAVAHRLAMEGLGFDTLNTITESNIVKGKLQDRGYRYLPEVEISLQGQSAFQSWQSALNLAKILSVSIEVLVEWHQKDEAAHPGEKGKLSWSPR